MFVGLIESLRCPRPHADSPLVVAAGRTEDRHVVDGILGCPVCGAEFPVTGGIARFEFPARPTLPAKPDAELGVRLAAFLDLTDARGFGLLCGTWAAQLDPVQRVTDTPIALVNPPVAFGGTPAGVLLCGDVVPLAASSARAAAVDGAASAAQIASAVRAVRAGGRVVGPVSLVVPDGVKELTRDDTLWVGEKQATPRLVNLERATS